MIKKQNKPVYFGDKGLRVACSGPSGTTMVLPLRECLSNDNILAQEI